MNISARSFHPVHRLVSAFKITSVVSYKYLHVSMLLTCLFDVCLVVHAIFSY